MKQLSLPRLQRLLLNDILAVAKPLLYGTLAILGVTTIVYLANADEAQQVREVPINVVMFAMMLLGLGVVFTSKCFADMHHPLQRYQYLMMPCSNLERMLARWLLTGPILILYVLIAFSVMDWIANGITAYFLDARYPRFDQFSADVGRIIKIYLLAHVVTITGAICFRSYHLVRTVLSVLFVALSTAALMYVSIRIFYYSSFSWSSFDPVKPIRLPLLPVFEAHWMNVTVVVAFAAWLLFIAYRCLRQHEVQE